MMPNLQENINKASRKRVLRALKKIGTDGRTLLLADTNHFKQDTLNKIKELSQCDCTPTESHVNDISEYIAASCVSHYLDGWSYLASSVSSFMLGKKSIAVHLAYYAELRASMAILASEGIGVFDCKHLLLHSDDDSTLYSILDKIKTQELRRPKQMGTHVFAWEAYNCLMEKLELNTSKVFSNLFYQGNSINELINSINFSSNTSYELILKKWLKLWASDINNFVSDRKYRNEVSYRPQQFSGHSGNGGAYLTQLKSIMSFFELLAPDGTKPFVLLDESLFYKLLTEIRQASGIDIEIGDTIIRALEDRGVSLTQTIRSKLNDKNHLHDHEIFNHAKIADCSEPLSVISRATLLLRFADAFVDSLFQDAEINKNSLGFVWSSYARSNGFVSHDSNEADYPELWSEIQDSLNDLSDRVKNNNVSCFDLCSEHSQELIHLAQLNRAALWNLNND